MRYELDEIEQAVYELAADTEPYITEDILKIARAEKLIPEELENRIKSEDTLIKKLHERSDPPSIDELPDIVRYTYLAKPDEYTRKVLDTMKDFEELGYDIFKVKNTWLSDPMYHAVHLQITAENGTRFEVQFHTPDSFRAKQESHGLYEEHRILKDKPRDLPKRMEMESTMKQQFQNLEIPGNVEIILDSSHTPIQLINEDVELIAREGTRGTRIYTEQEQGETGIEKARGMEKEMMEINRDSFERG